jgi:serine protease
MSLGGTISTALDTAIRNSIAAGVVYAVAAGNENADACNGSPSRVGQALTVGASTDVDGRASFSNFGVCLDLFAPGAGITSAWITSNTATRILSGTSMASPHVAGAAALVLEDNPTASAAEIAQTIATNASTDKLANVGAGSPNKLLFTLTQEPNPTPDPVPVAAYGFSCNGLTCNFNASSSTDNAAITAYAWNFGDGKTASGAIVAHTFGAAGTYNVVLTVTDTAAQTDTETKSVSVSDDNQGDPCTSCTKFSDTLAAGTSEFQPNGTYYRANVAGTHRGWLRGPVGANFDLYLYRWNGFAWRIVARSIAANATEQITFTGPSGYYTWRIVAVTGSGAYDFFLQRP